MNDNGFLFKFRALDKYSLENLANYTLWFAAMDSFNDPFEGTFSLNDNLGENSWVELLKTYVTKGELNKIDKVKFENNNDLSNESSAKKFLQNEFQKHIKGIRDNFGFLSLAVDSVEEPSHKNLHMWSHYSDGMRGFSLVFNKAELLKSLRELNNTSQFEFVKVNYVDNAPLINWDVQHIDGVISRTSILKILNTKHTTFEEENEIRFICDSYGLKKYSRAALKAVFVGEKMSNSEIQLLKTVLDTCYPGVKIYKTKFSRANYNIDSYLID